MSTQHRNTDTIPAAILALALIISAAIASSHPILAQVIAAAAAIIAVWGLIRTLRKIREVRYSPVEFAIRFFALAFLSSLIIVLLFGFVYLDQASSGVVADHGLISYWYLSAQYFFNTGNAGSPPQPGWPQALAIIESAIGYSWAPTYLGVILAYFQPLIRKSTE